MKFKHIHFIVNPASGKEEPILTYINKAMVAASIDWDVSVTKQNWGAGDIAAGLNGKTDLVAVYGGDGCVTAVASVLHGTNLPLAIIPGGTANVMAKELSVPLDTVEAIELLIDGKHQLLAVDMGKVNGAPFLLRVNLGVMADMVTKADPDLKESVGQLAYGVTTLKTLAEAQVIDYKLKVDGEDIIAPGISLTVTNSGSIGIGDFALQPDISITDGLLDVIIIKDNNFTSLLKIAGSTLLQQHTDALLHWKGKQIEISLPASQSYICDDEEKLADKLHIEVIPASIRLLVPINWK